MARWRRSKSLVPSPVSSAATWRLTAPCVTQSSCAALVKLRCRAVASKARIALSGGRRRMARPKLTSHPPVQAAVDGEEDAAHQRGEDDQDEGDRHDDVDIVQPDRAHQQVAEAALRCEHLAEQRADQGEREADPNAREYLGERRRD